MKVEKISKTYPDHRPDIYNIEDVGQSVPLTSQQERLKQELIKKQYVFVKKQKAVSIPRPTPQDVNKFLDQCRVEEEDKPGKKVIIHGFYNYLYGDAIQDPPNTDTNKRMKEREAYTKNPETAGDFENYI